MKKIIFLMVAAEVLILAALLAFAASPVHQQSYNITPGATRDIDEWGVKKSVRNNCTAEIFIPTNTSQEWQTFLNNKPPCMNVITYSPDGAPCALGTQCASGYCKNGVCWSDPCGVCHWVGISCSHYGGIWNGPEVSCDPAHAGVVVMMHHSTLLQDCGSQHLERYTSEYWSTCFTGRAQCVCRTGNVEPPTPVHSEADCIAAKGTVGDTDAAGLKLCIFKNMATCPPGWNSYRNYNIQSGGYVCAPASGCRHPSCTNKKSHCCTLDAAWGPRGTFVDWDTPNNPNYGGCTLIGSRSGGPCCEGFWYPATVSQVGCY